MPSLAESLQEYARGVAGGLMFSLPLLYTMEMWWSGFIVRPEPLLAYLGATFLLLLGYNRYAGLRRDASRAEVMIDSIEEMGLGLLIAALVLWLLGRISLEATLYETVGKIVLEGMVVAIGVSVGTAQLGGGENGASNDGNNTPGDLGDLTQDDTHFTGQLVIALCGAVLFASNVGPTDEIALIAATASSGKLLAIALLSLLLSALILFHIDFTGAHKFVRPGPILHIMIAALVTYSVALFASATILWFFGRFDGVALISGIAQTVVLGLAATLGASAGRLLLQK